ncbi:MAG: LON peptidase substrate-binding domain-containing protein [Candidatus Nanopelagicales bacterium]
MTQPPSGDPSEGDALIPLFPLGTVLVPGLLLPLHVFEPRYRELVATLLDQPEDRREFGVVAIREGHEVGSDAVRALYEVGTTAVIRQVTPHDDGRYELVTTGARRFRLLGVDDSLPYLQGRVSWLPELRSGASDPTADAEVDVLAASVARAFAAYRSAVTGAGAEEGARMPDLPDDPTVLSYLVGAAMVLDLADRQRLLERPDAAARLRAELALLRRETGVLRALPSLPAVELARTGVVLN